MIPPVASTLSDTDSGVEVTGAPGSSNQNQNSVAENTLRSCAVITPDADVAAFLLAQPLLLGPPVAVVRQVQGLVEHLVVVAGVVDVAGGDEVRELPDEVLAADGDRVQAEFPRGLVHHLLEHPVVHLGAEAPVGALLVLVGQRRPHPVTHAADRVRADDLGQGVAVMAHAELDVGAVVVDDVDLDAAHGAVAHHRRVRRRRPGPSRGGRSWRCCRPGPPGRRPSGRFSARTWRRSPPACWRTAWSRSCRRRHRPDVELVGGHLERVRGHEQVAGEAQRIGVDGETAGARGRTRRSRRRSPAAARPSGASGAGPG